MSIFALSVKACVAGRHKIKQVIRRNRKEPPMFQLEIDLHPMFIDKIIPPEASHPVLTVIRWIADHIQYGVEFIIDMVAQLIERVKQISSCK